MSQTPQKRVRLFSQEIIHITATIFRIICRVLGTKLSNAVLLFLVFTPPCSCFSCLTLYVFCLIFHRIKLCLLTANGDASSRAVSW